MVYTIIFIRSVLKTYNHYSIILYSKMLFKLSNLRGRVGMVSQVSDGRSSGETDVEVVRDEEERGVPPGLHEGVGVEPHEPAGRQELRAVLTGDPAQLWQGLD